MHACSGVRRLFRHASSNGRAQQIIMMERMAELGGGAGSQPVVSAEAVHWLQGLTLGWMLVECGVSLWAAATAHSSALLAFGADSLVELLSATVVLLQFVPAVRISERTAARAAAALLFVLAGVVAITAMASIAFDLRPSTSRVGIAITAAALVGMPLLAWLKRREAQRRRNAALAADAVQSATCAWLALITLASLAIHAAYHVPWIDSAGALLAVALLVREGRASWRGQTCHCH